MNTCIFCNGERKKIYNLNGYEIYQCINCKTSSVKDMPTIEEIKNYYNGFVAISPGRKKRITQNLALKKWFESFNLPPNAKLLDVGGGGGLIPYAFEKFGFGEGHYIDIDKESCEFARDYLNLTSVINDDVKNLANYAHQKYDLPKYDLIYSRHVIEHLIDPLDMINTLINLLNDGAAFVLEFPNGMSLENQGYRDVFIQRYKKLARSNNWGVLKTLSTMFSPKVANGIDPVRHLWAISSAGITAYLSKRDDIEFKILTATLSNPVYSPYITHKNIMEKLHSAFIENTLGKIDGATHLVAIITKKS